MKVLAPNVERACKQRVANACASHTSPSSARMGFDVGPEQETLVHLVVHGGSACPSDCLDETPRLQAGREFDCPHDLARRLWPGCESTNTTMGKWWWCCSRLSPPSVHHTSPNRFLIGSPTGWRHLARPLRCKWLGSSARLFPLPVQVIRREREMRSRRSLWQGSRCSTVVLPLSCLP